MHRRFSRSPGSASLVEGPRGRRDGFVSPGSGSLRASVALPLLAVGLLFASACTEPAPGPSREEEPPAQVSGEDGARAAGLRAYETVYEVLTHPRCMNCHPTGDRPLQHDDSRPHDMNVQRGPDDRGRTGMRCVACHQQTNNDLAHRPPGSSTWRLAPAEQAFQDRSPRQLAAQLLDPAKSHMNVDELIEHVRDDALVGWGWEPGPGRRPVPVSRDDFVAAFRAWSEAGNPIPAEEAQ